MDDAKVRLITGDTWFDVENLTYNEAAWIHAGGRGVKAFDVSAKEFGDTKFRRMSIAVDQVTRVVNLVE